MTSPSKTALVTGGAGFIGSHLAAALAQKGWRVKVIDDLSNGQRARVQSLGVEFIEGSILDAARLAQAVRGVEVIFHHAALAGVPQSVAQPAAYHEADATGTLRVLEAARAAGVRRLIYAGSSSAYGEKGHAPKTESMLPSPISPYAAAKLAGEYYLSVWAAAYGLETLTLRYFNVFGPHQDPQSQYGAAIPAIVTRMLQGQPPTIYGDGTQTRDFCYIDNVVHANLLAAQTTQPLHGQVINIACGKQTTVNDIVALTNQILSTSIVPQYVPKRPGDIRDSVADISLARSFLGYEPAVFFAQGLQRWIDWKRATP